MISIVTPAFNEAANLKKLHARIVETMARLGVDWEWIVVDDHSRDETFAVLQRLSATRLPRSRRPPRAELRIARRDRLRHAASRAATPWS